ncbi:MAG: hypothetical protein LC732_06330 [Acidobacteria bacterium]|nr:hypothetical protein [Acidobacteriota bacterium]
MKYDPRGPAHPLHAMQGMRSLALLAAILLVHCMPVPNEETARDSGTATAPAAAGVDEQAVRAVVAQFGHRLRNVSILGPVHVLESSIRREYAPYVTPELLNAWLAEPTSAPGRLTSSPWPERIEITSVREDSPDQCVVTGEIVESTSSGDAPRGTPVEIEVRRVGGDWRIARVTR